MTTTFADLDLIEQLQRALTKVGYENPTPIQEQAIPLLLDGKDVLGCAQTGTGKTAAFTLPILQHLHEDPAPRGKPKIRVLVMTPTRELAAQIGESFASYGRFLKHKHTVVFGGVKERPQIATLRSGVEILVATPGRLLDLQGRGFIDLTQVEFFVLDEADRMLDMGFVHDVRRVLEVLPEDRQNLLFSATLPPSIRKLADSFLYEPEFIAVTPQATTVERIQQSVMFVERADKRHLLVDLLRPEGVERAIVFTRTKHGANRLVKQLAKAEVEAMAIHGNKSQAARKRALDGFKRGTVQVLVATDIASRGIDVDGVSHVFNFDLPNEPESYVHRIGRTARAGREGVAVSFCDLEEVEYLQDIERTIGQAVPRVTDHAYHLTAAEVAMNSRAPRSGGRGGSRGGRGGSRGGGGRGGPRGGRGGGRGGAQGGRGGRPRGRSGASRGPSSERSGGSRGGGGGGRTRSPGSGQGGSRGSAPSFGGGSSSGGSRGRGRRRGGGGGPRGD